MAGGWCLLGYIATLCMYEKIHPAVCGKRVRIEVLLDKLLDGPIPSCALCGGALLMCVVQWTWTYANLG